MNPVRAFASWLMRAAAMAAPRDKSEWMQGMRAEFDVLENDGAALSWAAGCFGSALGWRMKAEAIYILALVAVFLWFREITGEIWIRMAASYQSVDISGYSEAARWRLADEIRWNGYLIDGITLALITFALCLYRPRRLVLTPLLLVLCMVAIGTTSLMTTLMTYADHPAVRNNFTQPWTAPLFALQVAWADTCQYTPTAFGASALAWLSHRLWRKRRARS